MTSLAAILPATAAYLLSHDHGRRCNWTVNRATAGGGQRPEYTHLHTFITQKDRRLGVGKILLYNNIIPQ